MIEALSGRLAGAGFNSPSYKIPNIDSRPQQSQSDSIVSSDDAVTLSLSPEALNHLKQMGSSAGTMPKLVSDDPAYRDQLAKRLGITAREGESAEDLTKRYSDIQKLNGSITLLEAKLSMRDAMAKHLDSMRASYQKMASTPPKAAVALNAQEITEVVKKAKALGLDPLGAHMGDNYSFGIEGKIYTFGKDGTATVHEAGVATSKEQQQQALRSMADFIAKATDPMSDVTAERDELVAQREV
jgi:hypothetical protein